MSEFRRLVDHHNHSSVLDLIAVLFLSLNIEWSWNWLHAARERLHKTKLTQFIYCLVTGHMYKSYLQIRERNIERIPEPDSFREGFVNKFRMPVEMIILQRCLLVLGFRVLVLVTSFVSGRPNFGFAGWNWNWFTVRCKAGPEVNHCLRHLVVRRSFFKGGTEREVVKEHVFVAVGGCKTDTKDKRWIINTYDGMLTFGGNLPP